MTDAQSCRSALVSFGQAVCGQDEYTAVMQLALEQSTSQIVAAIAELSLPVQYITILTTALNSLKAEGGIPKMGWLQLATLIDPLLRNLCKESVQVFGIAVIGKKGVAYLLNEAVGQSLEELISRLPEHKADAYKLMVHSGDFILEHGPYRCLVITGCSVLSCMLVCLKDGRGNGCSCDTRGDA